MKHTSTSLDCSVHIHTYIIPNAEMIANFIFISTSSHNTSLNGSTTSCIILSVSFLSGEGEWPPHVSRHCRHCTSSRVGELWLNDWKGRDVTWYFKKSKDYFVHRTRPSQSTCSLSSTAAASGRLRMRNVNTALTSPSSVIDTPPMLTFTINSIIGRSEENECIG